MLIKRKDLRVDKAGEGQHQVTVQKSKESLKERRQNPPKIPQVEFKNTRTCQRKTGEHGLKYSEKVNETQVKLVRAGLSIKTGGKRTKGGSAEQDKTKTPK